MNAKFLLAASLLLNLTFLLGALLELNPRVAGPSTTVERTDQVPSATTQEPVTRPNEAPHLFQWSQVESSDYATYIANLRRIGCPEQTVREIVAADVDDLFVPRREPWLAKMTIGGVAASERSRAEAALLQLRQEENAFYRQLFGIPEPAKPVPATAMQVAVSPPVRARRPVVEDTNAAMPLVIQRVNTNAVNLSADELQTIDQVRQAFVAALGTNQDVNSLEYLHRWQTAQKQADNLLDALLGRQAVLKYEAMVQSQPASSSPAPLGN